MTTDQINIKCNSKEEACNEANGIAAEAALYGERVIEKHLSSERTFKVSHSMDTQTISVFYNVTY